MGNPWRPSLDVAVQYCREHPLPGSGMLIVQLLHQFLCVLALGIPVNWTAAGHYGQIILLLKSNHFCLVYEHDRADYRQIHAIQIGLWREGVEASFKYQGQQHGLDDIILVVGVGYFVAAHLLDRLIKSAFTHLGTQRAGVAFFTLIKQDMGDIRLYDLIGNSQFFS